MRFTIWAGSLTNCVATCTTFAACSGVWTLPDSTSASPAAVTPTVPPGTTLAIAVLAPANLSPLPRVTWFTTWSAVATKREATREMSSTCFCVCARPVSTSERSTVATDTSTPGATREMPSRTAERLWVTLTGADISTSSASLTAKSVVSPTPTPVR